MPPSSSLMVASPFAIAMPSAESHLVLRSSRGTQCFSQSKSFVSRGAFGISPNGALAIDRQER